MISILMPTYNRLELLKKAICSIEDNFNGLEYEIVYSDGGSTDGTVDFLRQLEEKGDKVIFEGRIRGTAHSMNDMMKIADGEYCFTGNDDMLYYYHGFKDGVDLLDSDSSVGIVFPKVIEEKFGKMFYYDLHAYHSFYTVFGGFLLWRKREYSFDTSRFFTGMLDYDMDLRALVDGKSIVFTRNIGGYHLRYGSGYEGCRKIVSGLDFNSRRLFLDKWLKLRVSIANYIGKYKDIREKCGFGYNKRTFFYDMHRFKYFSQEKRNDKLLEILDMCCAFKDSRFNSSNLYFLAQKYPKEVLDDYLH